MPSARQCSDPSAINCSKLAYGWADYGDAFTIIRPLFWVLYHGLYRQGVLENHVKPSNIDIRGCRTVFTTNERSEHTQSYTFPPKRYLQEMLSVHMGESS